MHSTRHRIALRILGSIAWGAALGLALGGCALFTNLEPTAAASADRTEGEAPLVVRFDGSASTDPDGIVTTYLWEFGDGLSDTSRQPSHTYALPGDYAVRLTVLDNDGARSETSLTVSVQIANAAPTASFTFVPSTPVPDEAIDFDATGSTDADGVVVTYAWDFGDGTGATEPIVEHVYEAAGIYAVVLVVADNQGRTGEQRIDLTVIEVGEPPVAKLSVSSIAVDVGDPIAVDASGSYDPDGVLSDYAWTFGDGTTAEGATALHAYAEPGTYAIVLEVTDSDGLRRSASCEILVAQDPDSSSAEVLSRTYSWTYDGLHRTATVDVPKSIYEFCQAQPRDVWPYRDYDAYVLDTLDDALMEQLASDLALSEYHVTAENALAFVQSAIAYQADTTPFEYPRYPAETLVDGAGDCEDTAILYASLIRTLGRGALLVSVDTDGDGNADHMVVFVPVDLEYCNSFPCGSRSFWQVDGELYAFAETAMSGGTLPLGVDPWDLSVQDIEQTWDVRGVDLSSKMIMRL